MWSSSQPRDKDGEWSSGSSKGHNAGGGNRAVAKHVTQQHAKGTPGSGVISYVKNAAGFVYRAAGSVAGAVSSGAKSLTEKLNRTSASVPAKKVSKSASSAHASKSASSAHASKSASSAHVAKKTKK